MHILVTGATGFLGSHVVRALLAEQHNVVAMCRPESIRWRLADQGDRVQWVQVDLTDRDTIHAALEATRPQVIVHCAAYGMDYREQSVQQAIAINITGTQLLVEEAAKIGVTRFIHAGSCFEYGDKAEPVSETDVLEPIGMYGVTKAAGTLLTIQQSRASGLPAVVLRLFGIYGPYDREDKLVPRVIRACLAGTPIDLTGGEQVRDYTFIGDAVRAFVSLATGEPFPAGEIVNLAGGSPRSIRRIGEATAKLLNGEALLRWGVQPYRPDEMKTLTAKTDKAKRLLAWSASTSMEEGLRQTVQWYQRQTTEIALTAGKGDNIITPFGLGSAGL